LARSRVPTAVLKLLAGLRQIEFEISQCRSQPVQFGPPAVVGLVRLGRRLLV
jgi:hypothetical protein